MQGHIMRVNLKQAHKELSGKLSSLKKLNIPDKDFRVLSVQYAIYAIEQEIASISKEVRYHE